MNRPKITTLEQLNALPLWSAILTDADTPRPDVWQRLESGRERTLRDWTMVNDDTATLGAEDLPALLLWQPEEPAATKKIPGPLTDDELRTIAAGKSAVFAGIALAMLAMRKRVDPSQSEPTDA